MKGFTLIELLIVIAIIGILAVALLPTILGAPAKGRDSARLSNVNTVVTAIEGAMVDGVAYPSGTNCVGGAAGAFMAGGTHQKYFQGGQFPKDPSATSSALLGCAAGLHVYRDITDATAKGRGQNYWVATVVETPSNANSTVAAVNAANAAIPPVLSAPTSCTSTAPCAYVAIK